METYATARYCAETQEIVDKAIRWVATQLWKRQNLVYMPMKDWPVDHALFLGTEATHKAMDTAALSGDVEATKTAGRAYCKSWIVVLKAATGEE